jgi:hypothetical protein
MRTGAIATTMVGMTAPERARSAEALHADHLSRLAAALVGPRRVRRSLLGEAADHLVDATDALVAGGLAPAEAARRAVADFGSVEEVAPGYQEILAVASARRTAWLLLLALSYQPFVWDSGPRLGAVSGSPPPGSTLYPLLDTAIEVGGAVVLLGAVLAVLTSGIGQRWLPAGRRTARLTAGFAVAGAVLMVALCLGMGLLLGAPLGFWTLITVLLACPMAAVTVSARHTLATAR